MNPHLDPPETRSRSANSQTEAAIRDLGPAMSGISDFLLRQWASWDERNWRMFLERQAARYTPPATPASNMCKLSCAFMAAAFPELSVSGGDPRGGNGGGMLDIGGHWQTHFWLVHKSAIIDPTASQFGYGSAVEILFTTRDDPRYNANLQKFEIDNIMKNCRMTAVQWLDAWRACEACDSFPDAAPFG